MINPGMRELAPFKRMYLAEQCLNPQIILIIACYLTTLALDTVSGVYMKT